VDHDLVTQAECCQHPAHPIDDGGASYSDLECYLIALETAEANQREHLRMKEVKNGLAEHLISSSDKNSASPTFGRALANLLHMYSGATVTWVGEDGMSDSWK
jgi:hypothetical protein